MTRTSISLQLSQFLQKQRMASFTIKFEEIEAIIARKLPPSARKYQAWWGNCFNQKTRHCAAWLEYGWMTKRLTTKMSG